jgi:hypothetical protein
MSELEQSLLEATAEAAQSSAKTVATLILKGDLEGAHRALVRAQQKLGELARKLPWHARMRRETAACVALAEQALVAPVREENDETGEIVPKREKVARKALRAQARARDGL